MKRKPIHVERSRIGVPRFMTPTVENPYGYIYLTVNTVNGNMYIGKHARSEFDKKYLGSGKYLWHAINKYGKEVFVTQPIQWCKSLDELNEAERWWISYMGAVVYDEFYNLSDGGDGLSSSELKRFRLIDGKNNPMYGKGYKVAGEKNGMFGKTHTDEVKKKLSELCKQRIGDKNHFYNKHHSDETKRKISEKNLGRKHTEEWKRQASAERVGKIWVNDNWDAERFIDPLELQSLLSIGWALGRLSYQNKHKVKVVEGGRGMSLTLKVRYHEEIYGELPKLRKLEQGDWIDLYSAEDVDMSKDEFRLLSLGVSMELPAGYEAHIATRSSTFKTWGVLMANSHGIIDESYKGDNDIWKFPALAMRDTHIAKGDRICQFRLVKKMEEVNVVVVSELHNPDRGGLGSTGKQ